MEMGSLLHIINTPSFVRTRYQHIVLLAHRDTILVEYGGVDIVIGLTHAHQRCGELVERVCFGILF